MQQSSGTETGVAGQIAMVREVMGRRIAILAHHYQHDDVVRHADIVGDSLELARRIEGLKAEYIVFCGVSFMAETAAILAGPYQSVRLPDMEADCIMAAMAPARRVENVIAHLAGSTGRRIIPLAYVNTSAEVKAVVGRLGGAVCTSANAARMMEWGLAQGDAVCFLPDKNLAANTADALGIAEDERVLLDVRGDGRNVDPVAAGRARLFVWPGMCAIHHRMRTEHVAAARAAHPGALLVVHPECRPEVVKLADAAGSTRRIIEFCEQAPGGATIIVGTELNLVQRLAARHAPDKRILPLLPSICENMGKITEEKLLHCLQKILSECRVTVPEELSEPARLSITRMLEACA